jgi:hypothetical protein
MVSAGTAFVGVSGIDGFADCESAVIDVVVVG